MAFLRSKSRNRRRNSRKRKMSEKTSTSWIHGNSSEESAKTSRKLNTVNQNYHQLNAKIGVLEEFLAGHAMAAENRDQMRRNNILPPPESTLRHQARRKMSAMERRKYLASRERGGLKFFALFCLASAIGWWLLKTGL